MFINSRLNRHLLEGDDGSGEGSGGTGEGGAPAGSEGTASGSGERTFTQQEMSARAAQEKAEGKRAAEKSIADQLGVSVEEAKTIIAAANAKADAEKSEAQRAIEAANAKEATAAEREAAAARRVHDADVRDALRDAGVDKSKVAKVSSMLSTLEVGAEEAAITKEVEALKKEFPELFGVTTGAPHSDPGKGPGGKPPTEDAMTRGAERFSKTASANGSYPILEKS